MQDMTGVRAHAALSTLIAQAEAARQRGDRRGAEALIERIYHTLDSICAPAPRPLPLASGQPIGPRLPARLLRSRHDARRAPRLHGAAPIPPRRLI